MALYQYLTALTCMEDIFSNEMHTVSGLTCENVQWILIRTLTSNTKLAKWYLPRKNSIILINRLIL